MAWRRGKHLGRPRDRGTRHVRDSALTQARGRDGVVDQHRYAGITLAKAQGTLGYKLGRMPRIQAGGCGDDNCRVFEAGSFD